MTEFTFPSIRRDAPTLILGLGQTGAAAARWCARHGAPLRVLDTREAPRELDALRQSLAGCDVDYRLGSAGFDASALDDVGAVVISPGLSPQLEPIKGLLNAAAERRIEVIGEIELFARALNDLSTQDYQPRVLAVTGTNGKTTVTVMTRDLAMAGGLETRCAGNIGPAALTALQEALEQGLPDVWVLELSSFQLMSTYSLKPDAAVVLNISQDHLDWHGSMDAYVEAKARLLQASKIAVVNRDDAHIRAMVADLRSPSVRSFGLEAPQWEGDTGLDESHDVSWLAVSEPNDFDPPAPTSRRKKKQEIVIQREPGRVSRLMPVDALRVRGVHNAMNALAALSLVRCLDVGWAGMLHALRDYAGEANRTEYVRTVAGVDFINDSKGTNVGATLAALQGLGQRVVLIAGGVGKGQDFSVLASAVQEHARAVVLIGQDADLIAQTLEGASVTERADTLPAAVQRAFELAQSGDAVLLSPACASMDMFKDYVHRGQVFIDAVESLALDNGEVA